MHKSQIQSNYFSSNRALTSVTVTQEKSYQKKQILPVRTGPVNKLQAKKRSVVYHQYISHISDRISHPANRDEKGCFLKEMNNFSVYKNNDHIILPKRKHRLEPRVRCFYCGEWFNRNENISGSCKEAPDPVEVTIRFLTCYPVAEGAVYHCCKSDDDMPVNISRFGQGYNVFSFGPRHIPLLKRVKRLLFLALMSLVAPCLCCYFPAHTINKCFGGGKRGRHQSYHSTTTFDG
ncbi:Spred1 [Loa loa]|uniref:Spred1 n=1 Tax=Loa loa TaxID=7209 RepID=A0A1S0TR72_LOALO|nr:Spred1 [Loa loa]EFO18715.1 Spred1 [Loa loa]